MNGTHLPAGQPMPGGVAGVASSPALNGGRRRPPQQYQQYHHHPQHAQHGPPVYTGSYMNPFATSYYPPHMSAHNYQNGHAPAYNMHYNQYPLRSPPAVHQAYPPIVSSSMQPVPQPYPYARPSQSSPAMSTPSPYATTAPPPPAPVSQTPTSAEFSQSAVSIPSPPEPETAPEPLTPQTATQSVTSTDEYFPHIRVPAPRQLPWLSVKDEPFPARSTRSKRRRRPISQGTGNIQLPRGSPNSTSVDDEAKDGSIDGPGNSQTPKVSTAKAVSPEAKSTEHKETIEEKQDQPASPPARKSTQAISSPVVSTGASKHDKVTPEAAVPVVSPTPKASPKAAKSLPASDEQPPATTPSVSATVSPGNSTDVQPDSAVPAPPAKLAPKTWSGLFARGPTTKANSGVDHASHTATATAGSSNDANGHSGPGNFVKSNASTLAEALRAYNVAGDHKLAFLEPRGLINTGNMCYMNSVLQVLIFCTPFYDFLEQVNKKATHSFKSETPLIDAMVMFMREYKVIDSASSVEQLRRRLKSEELEQFGEAFTPEFVYDAIRQLPRFSSMQRGHQQDAEEFLGFFLESLHDECSHVMRHTNESSVTTAVNSSAATPTLASSPTSTTDTSDWLEVGRRQRAAVTRSSGHQVDSSPLTKIFGGQLRSELRVPGLKDSVTLEPFQPLQLDIGSPQVRNIMDALKNLTKPETIRGDFHSPRGPDAVATKQVLIESVPPVLILHLKRFQFDAAGTGTVKIWKKVGYPLELELPKELFARQKRNTLNAEGGFPKYKLMAAVYHHGKNASGGHYTVDLRRQDGQEWVRLDDTVIRRIRSEDVAEAGAEETPNKAAAWSDKKESANAPASGNRFEGIGDENGDEDGWNKVSAPANGTKKWSSVVNEPATNNASATKAKPAKDNSKDNKVAYLLFYVKI